MSKSLIFFYHRNILWVDKLLICTILFLFSCSKDPEDTEPKPDPKPEVTSLICKNISVDGVSNGSFTYNDIVWKPEIALSFTTPVDKSSVSSSVHLTDKNDNTIPIRISYTKEDSVMIIKPSSSLSELAKYKLSVATTLTAQNKSTLKQPITLNLVTKLDSTDKYPMIPDDELLTLVQQQTFKYFWDFGHPTSGMARERSTSGNTVTTGGTGFGIMAMIVAVERGFITRDEALARIQKITTFLKDRCTAYHGVFAHWINGETGVTQPFSTKDDGGDLVETSFLFQGLLTARQYFSANNAAEEQLRSDITGLWEAIEWDWYRQNGQNVLYWHWSPNYGWEMNHKIQGWNECLITYVLAASSPTHSIPKEVYDQGWARNGNMKNGGQYYNYTLPLGSDRGGPLFFSHYSFLGMDPRNLSDVYANYWIQNTGHSKINYSYCVENPKKYFGYSADCWGLTASDGDQGYSAHSPTNDKGVISPTAALSAMPYTPEESMAALHFFYYKLGDKMWKEYGFVDAFNMTMGWYDNQFLAIDQGPIIVMIENHRTGLIWNTFMTCPEVQAGLTKLGFSY